MTAGLALDLQAAVALAGRDLRRFFRQRSRIVGALGQPVLLWAIYGLGFGTAFRAPGDTGMTYLTYLYPGVLVMIVLFTAIFSTMSLIEDRHEGFLQLALVAPVSRTALAVGKSLGGTVVALIQAALFLLFAPLAGFPYMEIAWWLLFAALLGGAIGLTALGFTFAWAIDSTQGYHGVMMILLIPMWVLSGAMFPAQSDSPVMNGIMRWNPMTYVVEAVRRGLAGGHLSADLAVTSLANDLVVIGIFSLATISCAALVCSRRR